MKADEEAIRYFFKLVERNTVHYHAAVVALDDILEERDEAIRTRNLAQEASSRDALEKQQLRAELAAANERAEKAERDSNDRLCVIRELRTLNVMPGITLGAVEDLKRQRDVAIKGMSDLEAECEFHATDRARLHAWFELQFGESLRGRDFPAKCSMASRVIESQRDTA
jgi:hypothetical protein